MLKVLRGFIYGISFGFLFTLNNLLIKVYKLDFVDVVFVRSVCQAMTFAAVLTVKGEAFLPNLNLKNELITWKSKCLVQLQGIFGSVVRLTSLGAVILLPVGDALTLIFAGPLFTMFLGRVFLKISITLWKLFFGLLSIAGVAILVQPDFIFHHGIQDDKSESNTTGGHIQESSHFADFISERNSYTFGVGLALSSAFFGSLNSVSLAHLKDVSPYLLVFYGGAWNGFIITIIAPFDKNSEIFSIYLSQISLEAWALLTGIAFLGIIGYVAVVKALHLIDPTIVTVLATLEIVFGYIGQVIFLHQQPTLMSLIGAGLVLTSVLAISCEELLYTLCHCHSHQLSNDREALIIDDSLETEAVTVSVI